MERSKIIIGVDEAGYGPNLGPLVVSASVWRIPEVMTEDDFIEALACTFSTQAWCDGCTHVPLGDSKKLYASSTGIRTLEAGWLAMHSIVGPCNSDFNCVLRAVTTGASGSDDWQGTAHAWYHLVTQERAMVVEADEIARLTQLAQSRLADCAIELVKLRAVVVTETVFNGRLRKLGTKAHLLASVTMELVTGLLQEFECDCVEVYCDRQGGRKRYACVLLDSMPHEWFDVLGETAERSSYRRLREPELRVHFSVGGDSFPATALASMTAKYMRERLMVSINSYWRTHMPDLRPTAGYPGDARRFREQIEPVAARLGHDVDDWWRAC